MIGHLGVSTGAFFSKQEASAEMPSLVGIHYNANYLRPRPGTVKHEKPPITTPQPLRVVSDIMGMPMANADMVSLNPATNYNANYLQHKKGTTLKDPKLTYWTAEQALRELKTSAGELTNEEAPKTSVLEKMNFIVENTQRCSRTI